MLNCTSAGSQIGSWQGSLYCIWHHPGATDHNNSLVNADWCSINRDCKDWVKDVILSLKSCWMPALTKFWRWMVSESCCTMAFRSLYCVFTLCDKFSTDVCMELSCQLKLSLRELISWDIEKAWDSSWLISLSLYQIVPRIFYSCFHKASLDQGRGMS